MTLANTLKTVKDIRKIFGKRELVIIEKQLWGVNLTASERTRLSRDIRKKFNAVQTLTPYIAEFNLKKGLEIKKRMKETLEAIQESKYFSKITEVILFGSVAENTVTFRSDIDIAVKFKDITLNDATRFRIEIAGRVSDKIDIQVYNVLPEKIKREIDAKGKVIYDRKND